MRTTMRVLMLLFVGALAVSLLDCHSEQVVQAASCSDPCCDGHPKLLDCGENPDVSCIESGDPCTAQAFGCVGGLFFERAQNPVPAQCGESDGGPDAEKANEPDGGLFAADDATADGGPDAIADGGPDTAANGAPDAIADGAPDAIADGGPDGP